MFRVKVEKRAEKQLKKLAPQYFKKVSAVLDELRENPFLGKKMSGNFKDHYRIKIPPIRIIYTIDHKSKTIYITALGHRGDIYK